MTHFSSDEHTIQALEKLTELIEDGLKKSWNPEIIVQAKNDIEQITLQAQEQIETVDAKVRNIERGLESINQQKAGLEKAVSDLQKSIQAADHLDQLVKQIGGVDTLKKNLGKLEGINFKELDQTLRKISEGKELVVSLQHKAQEIQKTASVLNDKIDNLGGENLLVQKFDHLQEISQRLDTIDSEIQLSINNFLNQYLPGFEAGKLQIEQWRKETITETEKTLESVNKKSKLIDNCIEKFNQDYEIAKTLLDECQRRELQLQSILDAITELTQSSTGGSLISELVKKLAELDSFISQERYELTVFKKEIETRINDSFKETLDFNEEKIKQKMVDLDGFITSAKSTLNALKKTIEENLSAELKGLLDKSVSKLEFQYIELQKLVDKNTQQFTLRQNQQESILRNEFQNLLNQETKKLQAQHLQEIKKIRIEFQGIVNQKLEQLEAQHIEEIKKIKNSHFRLW